MEANYVTTLWWFLPYINTNQPQVHMCPPSGTPSLLPPHPVPLGCSRALALSVLLHASNLDWSSVLHIVIYMFRCYSLKSSYPRLPPHSQKLSILYICVSFAAFHIGLSLASLQVSYICVNILYWCFSFWLTSLCIIGSSFIHLIGTDWKVLFFWLSDTVVCVYHSLLIHLSAGGHPGCLLARPL